MVHRRTYFALVFLLGGACQLPTLSAWDVESSESVDVSSADAGAFDVSVPDAATAADALANVPDANRADVFVVADVHDRDANLPDVVEPTPIRYRASPPRDRVRNVPAFLALPIEDFAAGATVSFAGNDIPVELDSVDESFAYYWVLLPEVTPNLAVEIAVTPGAVSGAVFTDQVYSFVHHMGEGRELISRQGSSGQNGTSIVPSPLGKGTRIVPGEYKILAVNVPVAKDVTDFSVLINFTLDERPAGWASIFSVGVGLDSNDSRIEIAADQNDMVYSYRDSDLAEGDAVVRLRRAVALEAMRVATRSEISDEEALIFVNDNRENYNSEVDNELERTADTNSRIVLVGSSEDLTSGQLFRGTIDEIRVLDGFQSPERLRYESEAMQRDFFTRVAP